MNRPNNTAKKQASSRVTPIDSVTDKLNTYFGGVQRFLQEFLFRAGRPMDTMWRVAQQRYAEGEFADAASRLRLVVKFRPEHAAAWYLLGSCELEEGNSVAAEAALRKALRLNPQHEEARFLLAVLNPAMPENEQPKYAPLSLAVQHFDGQALYYDQQNLYELGYVGHEEAFRAVSQFLNPNYMGFRVLDLGCGTGLAGLQFHSIAARMEGVDISQNMLYQAEMRRDEQERRIYDSLHHVDLRRYLLDVEPASIDIIVAANVFPYVGGLTPVFDGLAHALKPGGVVSFSVEPLEGDEFGLIPAAGRFGHSEPYIVEQAKRVGLEVLGAEPFEMFFGEPGIQYVLRKPAPNAPQPQAPQAGSSQTPPQSSTPQAAPPQQAPQQPAGFPQAGQPPQPQPQPAAPQAAGPGIPPYDRQGGGGGSTPQDG